jgi:hypothetical protein
MEEPAAMEYKRCDRCGDFALIGGHQTIEFEGDDHPLCASCYDDLKEWFKKADDAVHDREYAS